jgi:hypothetical protein
MHRKTILLHIAAWLVWYSLNSTYYLYQPISEEPLWPTLYNYLSLVVVFYAAYGIGMSYWKSTRITELLQMSLGKKILFFTMRWQLLALLGIAWFYIWCSWLVEYYFIHTGVIKNYQLPEQFLIYADSRFAREVTYLLGGMAWSAVVMIIRKKNEIIRAERALNVITMQENALMKNSYYKKMKDLRHTVKNALEEREDDQDEDNKYM